MSDDTKPHRIDRTLGEDRPIPRRDFLQGTLVGAAAALTGPLLKAYAADAPDVGPGAQGRPGYYPPLLTGLRGSHPGSFENAHALRDGRVPENGIDVGETYDLIVVGGGISGLSAAYFYRAQTSPQARILILDNHDDFGGHAKRNEFQIGGRTLLMNGGTLEIDSPRPYDAVAARLIKELGIDVAALSKKVEHLDFYTGHGLQRGVFFDKETFGADKLVVGEGVVPAAKLLADSPFSEKARQDFIRLTEGSVDYLPGLTSDQKKHRLAKISYRDFLRDVVKVDPAVIAYFQPRSHGEWAVGIDAVSALDVWALDFPGFQGMKLTPRVIIPEMGYTPAGYASTGGSETLHFPDGNATIARLLVRKLLPDAIPGSTAEDIVMARVDYSKLDRAGAPIRLRLSSTAVRAVNVGDPAKAREVAVTYIRDGKTFSVRARGCVLAGYNAMIPYLCPELPETQKVALHKAVKSPLVYTTVALRDWQSFKKLGIDSVYAPGSYHSGLRLNPKVDIGGYRSPGSPDEPILVHMMRVPTQPGLTEHEQNKAGRAELLVTPFATFERNIRAQLARTLGAGGFDPARDIEAITMNRWPHGYAAEFNPLFEPVLPPAQQPHVIARAQFGRITIANSDAGAAAYTDSAIDQAHRAVGELLEG
ncbi:MAG TPA: NAD(P)-binding protein [Steroidobacteraceae bacterium]|nr:NAD(P)-binding protein [Steroidobacteraceae bacterium]